MNKEAVLWVRFSKLIRDKIEKEAEKKGMKLSEMIREIIVKYFEGKN